MLITTKIAIYIILSIILLIAIPILVLALSGGICSIGTDIALLFNIALFILLPISGIIATYRAPLT